MNLQQTMSAMVGRELSLDEAKDFCNNQFGRVATYLREQEQKDKFIITWQVADVHGLLEDMEAPKITDEQAVEVLKRFERHHEGSMEQMFLDLQYHLDEWLTEQAK